jgi:hypothetical protein
MNPFTTPARIVGLLAALGHVAFFCADAAPAEFESGPSLPHPLIPPPLHWPGALLIGIIGWVAMAAVIGVVVRANAPPEALPKPSDREPPAASPIKNDE